MSHNEQVVLRIIFVYKKNNISEILEIVRLYLAGRGAGLLPFDLASIALVLVLMHIALPTKARLAISAAITLFWCLSFIFTSIKLSTLTHLQAREPRLHTKYPASDQIIDLAVIVGLCGLVTCVEAVRLGTYLFAPEMII